MKRISLVIIGLLSVSVGVFAQNVDDALRYSQIFYGGTSRFMSMGGAYTAVGGDISSLSQNPAGLGVFRSSEFTITPQLFHITTKANFFGLNTDNLYKFNLNQVGIVSNLVSNESGLVSLNVGYSFNKTNNFNQSVRIQGLNPTSSMADYWAQSVNAENGNSGVLTKDLLGVNGAYETFLIDTLPGSNRKYGTVFSHYGDNASVYGQNVRRLINNEGYTAEHALSIGGNYANKIFFGITLGINKINYTGNYEHLETAVATYSSNFKDFSYIDHYEHTGTGYSIKLGAIIKPVDAVRIGLAFHSPTWYKVNEYFFENYNSKFQGFDDAIFTSDPHRFQFALATPFRALAGVAVQIKKIGLLSADYEYVDYSTARFSQTGDGFDYSGMNNEIKNSLRAANNIRLGGELRLNQLYLRTGYGYYGKAFQGGDTNQNLDYRSLSFGVGFREQRVSIDFGFTNYQSNEKYLLYPLSPIDNSSIQPLAGLNINKNMFTLTLGYKFGY